MTEYLLQRTVLTSGVMSAYLYSDTADLIVPTFGSLIVDGELSERLDVLPGEIEMAELNLRVVEDYTNYVEGFWYNVLHVGKPQIKILLNEGNGETIFFWGVVADKTIVFSETSLIAGYERRVGKLRCNTMLDSFKDVPATDVIDYCQANLLTQGAGTYADWKFIKVRGILAAILKVGAFNGSYDITDIELPTTYECDITEFRPITQTVYRFSDIYCAFQTISTPSLVGVVYDFYNEYSDSFEILREICKTFAFIPQFYYDLSTNRWKIKLVTRGRTYSGTPITMPTARRSDNLVNVDQTVTAVSVMSGDKFIIVTPAWIKGDIYHQPFAVPNEAGINTPRNVKFEISETVLFSNSRWYSPAGHPDYWLFADTGSGVMIDIKYFTAYRYDTGGTVGGWTSFEPEGALCGLLYYRFNRRRKGFEREYKSIAATLSGTTSHTNIFLLSTTVIDDRVSSETYYVTDISKNIFSNEMTVKWAQLGATILGDQAADPGTGNSIPTRTNPISDTIVSYENEAVFYENEIVTY